MNTQEIETVKPAKPSTNKEETDAMIEVPIFLSNDDDTEISNDSSASASPSNKDEVEKSKEERETRSASMRSLSGYDNAYNQSHDEEAHESRLYCNQCC